jgi:hypothetical protein
MFAAEMRHDAADVGDRVDPDPQYEPRPSGAVASNGPRRRRKLVGSRTGERLDEGGLDQVDRPTVMRVAPGLRRIEMRPQPLHDPPRRNSMAVAGAEVDRAGAAEIVMGWSCPRCMGVSCLSMISSENRHPLSIML